MEAYKSLVAASSVRDKHVGSPPKQHKDKLLQTKLRDREVKEALKEERQAQKAGKEEERHESGEAAKFERAFHHASKRALKEERDRAKKEEHAATGQACEHGVWRCKICFPHKTGK